MKISREVNKQAKANNGLAQKVWCVKFHDKDLRKIAMMRGNNNHLTYEEVTRFNIDSDQDFTHGTIIVNYTDSSKNKKFLFDVRTVDSELFHDIQYTTKDENGNVLDNFGVEYPKSARGYKTGSLYEYFNHLLTDTFFMTGVDGTEVIKSYEEKVRSDIERINAQNSKKKRKETEEE